MYTHTSTSQHIYTQRSTGSKSGSQEPVAKKSGKTSKHATSAKQTETEETKHPQEASLDTQSVSKKNQATQTPPSKSNQIAMLPRSRPPPPVAGQLPAAGPAVSTSRRQPPAPVAAGPVAPRAESSLPMALNESSTTVLVSTLSERCMQAPIENCSVKQGHTISVV